MWQYKPSFIAWEEVDMQYRPVVGWGRLPETWSFVEALYVAEVSWTSRGSKETPPREIRSLQKFGRV